MSTQRTRRALHDLADELQLDVIELKITSKNHFKVVLQRRSDGATGFTILSGTPSDNRAMKNAKACMRHAFDKDERETT